MKIYKYFISYHFKGDSKAGMGSIGVDVDKKIEDMEELEEIKERIERDLEKESGIRASVGILNFQLLSIQEIRDGNKGNS